MNGMRHCVFVLALTLALVAGIPLLTVDGVSTAIGLNHLCILAASDAAVGGAALCTGNPEFGKTAPPEDVVFVQLAAGLYFTCGLSVDQRVHCWGQISNTPEDGLYMQISAGNYFACGLLIDGQFKCWGQDKVLTSLLAPGDRDSGGEEVFVQLSCGPASLCALASSGYTKCWGSSGVTQSLSPRRTSSHNNQTSSQFSSVSSLGVENRFRQVSVGDDVTCGIRYPSGDLVCSGSLKKYGIPTLIEGSFLQVSVSSARLGMCAIRSDHSLECWGPAKSLAVFVKANTRWDQIEVGPSMVCAVSMTSELKCGGGNGIRIDFPRATVLA